MKAAVLRTAGMPLTIEDIDLDLPKPDEVMVTMLAAGVCHSDLMAADGTTPA